MYFARKGSPGISTVFAISPFSAPLCGVDIRNPPFYWDKTHESALPRSTSCFAGYSLVNGAVKTNACSAVACFYFALIISSFLQYHKPIVAAFLVFAGFLYSLRLAHLRLFLFSPDQEHGNSCAADNEIAENTHDIRHFSKEYHSQ